MAIVLKDVFFFILWVFARVVPTTVIVSFYICGGIHIDDTGKFILGALVVTLMFGCWLFIALLFTNAVPALLWRYKARLPLRTVKIDGDTYKQIRLYGFWLFIGHDSDYDTPRTSLWRWSDDYMYREHRFEPSTFTDFINAHRAYSSSTSSNHELYVKGEKV